MIAVSGDKYVDLAERDYVQVGFARVSTYQTIEIDPESNRLIYRAWTEDHRTIDELTIDKPRRTRLEDLARESAANLRGHRGCPRGVFATNARPPLWNLPDDF